MALSRDIKTLIAMIAAIIFAGGVLAVALIALQAWNSWRASTATSLAPGGEVESRVMARQFLQRRGIAKLTKVTAHEDDGTWLIEGPAITNEGRTVHVFVKMQVTTTGKKRSWRVLRIVVNGRVYADSK